MISLKNIISRMMWASLQISLYIACCFIFFLSSKIFACPFCGPVETPISYTILRSSEAAVGESITRPQADTQGQRRQSFSLLSKIILTSTGRSLMPLDSSVDIEAAVETSFSGTALLFNLPATGWTAIQADEMLIGYVLQAPPAKQNFLNGPNRLAWFARWLEHSNAIISNDAYAEYALAPFQEVQNSVHAFDLNLVIDRLTDPTLPQQRRGFYGLLAGLLSHAPSKQSHKACTNALIEALENKPSSDFKTGLDGIIAGLFIAIGKKTLPLLKREGLFRNDASPINQRHLLQALRFCWEYPSDTITRNRVISITRELLTVPHLSREVIVDLSRYQDWESCDNVTETWDTLGAENPFIRPAIIGYLLACPLEKSSVLLTYLRDKNIKVFEEAQQAALIPFPAAAP